MNRKDLYRLIPEPSEIGAFEYSVIHNSLVDAISEWISSEDEEIAGFTLSVLSEFSHWSNELINIIAKAEHGDKVS